jgi:hypothetical protein
LDDQYELLKYFELHTGVPEDVRGYMATVVTLWVYGWLYYPFYALVGFPIGPTDDCAWPILKHCGLGPSRSESICS